MQIFDRSNLKETNRTTRIVYLTAFKNLKKMSRIVRK